MEFKIQDRLIGNTHPVFVIAELSANHRHDFDLAVKTLRAMKESGADCVKLQTYTAETMTLNGTQDHFRIQQGTIWDGESFHKLYEEAYTPWEWQPKLKQVADELGLICFSTPFDRSAVDFLEKMGVSAYKIASFEITDIPLIEYAASKGKPMILSNGIASLEDLNDAVAACRRMNNSDIALLKCTSAYPAPIDTMNLRTIPDMARRFDAIVGLSDHTLTTTMPAAAVALGACIIEKHFILDRALGGPDASFSLTPSEFRAMVNAVRETEKALGTISYELTEKTRNNTIFSRSLFAVSDIEPGAILTEDNIRSLRPGVGLSPKHLKSILGKRAIRAIQRGTAIAYNLLN